MTPRSISNHCLSFILLTLLVFGFVLRLNGLTSNHSFWTDENHVAIFTRAIIERGKPSLENGYSTGLFQSFDYLQRAVSVSIFGENELGVRLPSVMMGVLTILAVFLLGNKVFGQRVGLLAALIVTFLNIEIMWSRQARPYQGMQLFYLLSSLFAYEYVTHSKNETKNLCGFMISAVFASLTHGLGLIIFINGVIYILINKTRNISQKLLPLVVGSVLIISLFSELIYNYYLGMKIINNEYYYRIFLTNNYLPLVFLSGLGGVFLLINKSRHKLTLFFPVLLVQGFIAAFVIPQPFTRYLYIVLPFVILLASYFIMQFPQVIKYKYPTLLSLLVVAVLIGSLRDKFSFVPQKYYSLNADMHEIPEVDWKYIYGKVGEKLAERPDSIFITNWNDLPVWYLGEGVVDYLVRFDDQPVKKGFDPMTGAPYLQSANEFRDVVDQHPKGILIVDSWDNYVPDGVREYARDNLKEELTVDRLYPEQPRYWPVTVYSWGLDED